MGILGCRRQRAHVAAEGACAAGRDRAARQRGDRERLVRPRSHRRTLRGARRGEQPGRRRSSSPSSTRFTGPRGRTPPEPTCVDVDLPIDGAYIEPVAGTLRARGRSTATAAPRAARALGAERHPMPVRPVLGPFVRGRLAERRQLLGGDRPSCVSPRPGGARGSLDVADERAAHRSSGTTPFRARDGRPVSSPAPGTPGARALTPMARAPSFLNIACRPFADWCSERWTRRPGSAVFALPTDRVRKVRHGTEGSGTGGGAGEDVLDRFAGWLSDAAGRARLGVAAVPAVDGRSDLRGRNRRLHHRPDSGEAAPLRSAAAAAVDVAAWADARAGRPARRAPLVTSKNSRSPTSTHGDTRVSSRCSPTCRTS